jgi:hypothetical protein
MKVKRVVVSLLLIMSSLVFSNSNASEEKAIDACENKIRSIYGVDQFKHVEAEKIGHHIYIVRGKVKYQDAKHPFSCRAKRGQVLSYHYEGPSKYTGNRDNHHHKSHTGRNVAIGVGVAAIIGAILVNSSKDDSSKGDNKNSNHYAKNMASEDLEDSCHETVEGRIKRNYHTIRRVKFKHDTIKHDRRNAYGNGRVVYYNGDRTDFSFSCDFNRNGRVIDSSYSIY